MRAQKLVKLRHEKRVWFVGLKVVGRGCCLEMVTTDERVGVSCPGGGGLGLGVDGFCLSTL
ncbi:unnamed protein product [Ilex paraguariensis]|uniref:Uncharacterized protein n=1 Tax=Ilex paraguariensis TaxID=185542 RepID=A0ABC8TIP2_9AQUA